MNLLLTSLIHDSNQRSWRVQAGALLIIVTLLLGVFPAACLHAEPAGKDESHMRGFPERPFDTTTPEGMSSVRTSLVASAHDCKSMQSHVTSTLATVPGFAPLKADPNELVSYMSHVRDMATAGSTLPGSAYLQPPSRAPAAQRALLQVYRI